MHCSRREVAGPVDIRNQPRPLRLPTQLLPSALTRSLVVDRCKVGEPAKVLGCFLRGLADDRNVETAPDNPGDLSKRHALFRDPMISGSRRTLLKYEPIKMSSIEPVHRGPVVEPFAHICRNPLSPRDADQNRNETMVA